MGASGANPALGRSGQAEAAVALLLAVVVLLGGFVELLMSSHRPPTELISVGFVVSPSSDEASAQSARPSRSRAKTSTEVRAEAALAAVVGSSRGGWTPEIGRSIAERALAWQSWPYSFGAGDASGPTYGHAVDEASRRDGQVKGFDCSGLVLYALAPWRRVDHLASAQYGQAGSFHPALDQLAPGDLIFWSSDGTVSGVGHVAVYIGNGMVVQAPQSGAYVTVTPLDRVEAGRIGVTRPLT